jgi:hypothetical protein
MDPQQQTEILTPILEALKAEGICAPEERLTQNQNGGFFIAIDNEGEYYGDGRPASIYVENGIAVMEAGGEQMPCKSIEKTIEFFADNEVIPYSDQQGINGMVLLFADKVQAEWDRINPTSGQIVFDKPLLVGDGFITHTAILGLQATQTGIAVIDCNKDGADETEWDEADQTPLNQYYLAYLEEILFRLKKY